MTDTHIALTEAQKSYNAYWRDVVQLSLGLSEDAANKMTEAELACRITDDEVRREFVRRAIALNEANVRHYIPRATPLIPERSTSTPVVAALLAASGGYYVGGAIAAMLAAAAGYWLGYRYSASRFSEQTHDAEQHNEEVPDWKQTISDWERDVCELRAIR